MKIIAISDLHGNLPKIDACDLLLIAGDICPVTNHDLDFQLEWLGTEFAKWLDELPVKQVVGIAGNHDGVFQKAFDKVPILKWVYLQDTLYEYEGIKIYGSPWVPKPWDGHPMVWAFGGIESFVKEKWAMMPDCDILISHGPPYRCGDKVDWGEHVGSPSLAKKIVEKCPKVVINGHIHSGYGQYNFHGIPVFNCSLLDEDYNLVNQPTIVPWELLNDSAKQSTIAENKNLINGESSNGSES